MRHTPELWSISEYEKIITPDGQLLLGGVMTPMTAGINREIAKANARRIVACVNACAGISTEALESTVSVVLSAEKYGYVQNQRDGLMRVLQDALAYSDYADGNGFTPKWVADARAAISKAEAA